MLRVLISHRVESKRQFFGFLPHAAASKKRLHVGSATGTATEKRLRFSEPVGQRKVFGFVPGTAEKAFT